MCASSKVELRDSKGMNPSIRRNAGSCGTDQDHAASQERLKVVVWVSTNDQPFLLCKSPMKIPMGGNFIQHDSFRTVSWKETCVKRGRVDADSGAL